MSRTNYNTPTRFCRHQAVHNRLCGELRVKSECDEEDIIIRHHNRVSGITGVINGIQDNERISAWGEYKNSKILKERAKTFNNF